MNPKPKVLFLYTEIAEYFISACTALVDEADVYIVRWPVNSEAPFRFSISDQISILERDQFETKELLTKVKEISPDVIFCSGWVDDGYLQIVKEFVGKVPTVLSMDNHWNGSLKQRIACFFAQFTFLKNFDYAWVPGNKQVDYAKRLGFSDRQILTGYYTANVDRFNDVYVKSKPAKVANYPKSFLYLGRYVKHKGIFELWEAFEKYKEAGGSWSLTCVGTGDQWDNRVESERLFHVGFVQPEELPELIEKAGAYVLPSHFEPWGVSVHEMACAGLPLILSKEIGSIDAFLDEGKNGYCFNSDKVGELTEAMLSIDNLHENELIEMGENSHEKGNAINETDWVKTILQIIQG